MWLQIQAKYTDCLLLNKFDLISERELDDVLDHLLELNEDTPLIKVSASQPLQPDLVFGLDTKLFERGTEEALDWEALGSGLSGKMSHTDEIETKSVWRGGGRPGKGKKREAEGDGHTHEHGKGEKCDCEGDHLEGSKDNTQLGDEAPVDYPRLEELLKTLPFEVYRGGLKL